jgi:hypothetical protein
MAAETHPRDALIERAERDESELLAADARVASLFDVRFAIGGLFILWGALLTILGLFFMSADELRKSVGVNINLWLGLAMLALGVLFVLWGWLLPVVRPAEQRDAAAAATAPSRQDR